MRLHGPVGLAPKAQTACHDTHRPWTYQRRGWEIWLYSFMEDIRVRFGKALRARRKKLGVSQEEFADMCGLDRTYIGGIERGERNVSLVNLEKIAQALRLRLSQMFEGV